MSEHSPTEWQRSEERLTMVLNATSDGIWDCDLVNGTVEWNPSYDSLFGHRPKNTTDSWQWWIDQIHPDDRKRVGSSLEYAAKSDSSYGNHWKEEYRFKRGDGVYVYVEDHAFIARDSEGEATRIVGAMRDVSERRLAEQLLSDANTELESRVQNRTEELVELNRKLELAIEELRDSEREVAQRERLAAFGQMSSGIAHNLNNLLFPCVSLVDLLLSETTLTDKARDWAKLIKTGASDATELIARLGTLYNPIDEVYETIDLLEIMQYIQSIVESECRSSHLQSDNTIGVKILAPDGPLLVRGNQSGLRQVFTNLAFNAMEAMPSGGQITLRLIIENDSLIAVVEDTGGGMTPDIHAKCMQPFFTTKTNGTGLGLSLCHGIVERHDGKILIETGSDGTKFRVKLPRVDGIETPIVEIGRKELFSFQVLFIDDTEVVRKAAEALFQAFGHTFDGESNGAAGLKAIQNKSYDLVFCDYSMPGMNGREVALEIKKIQPDLPVILITGCPLPLKNPTNAPPPEDEVLAKPVAMKTLAEAMYRHVKPSKNPPNV